MKKFFFSLRFLTPKSSESFSFVLSVNLPFLRSFGQLQLLKSALDK